jgi:AraC family transcriptional regulator of adaptative response / DNA-3-methyladenine glycosylase II
VPTELLRDAEACYRVISSRDSRWDGRLYVGVLSTGVYCRPSCPARTPRQQNCRFYPSAAAAVAAGFRACRRCRPDALPGSRDDDHRADLAARALRLIRDGEVDAAGVAGLAGRLHVSERHLHRVLVEEVGVGPLRLAATRRAQTARLLIDQTSLSMAEVAFAAGFASIRQFNDVMRAEFGCPPSQLRRRPDDGRRPVGGGPGLTLRLRYREPYCTAAVWTYLRGRAVAGLESLDADGVVTRPVPAAGGAARVSVAPPHGGVAVVRLDLADLADLGPVVGRVRRWLDLDADPLRVDEALGADAGLAALVAARPGMRVPGTVDGFELAVRAVAGQQVSVAGAVTTLARLVTALGEAGQGFPAAGTVAAGGPAPLVACGLTRTKAAAIVALAEGVDGGSLVLDPGADRAQARTRLLALPGIGPWTAEYVALRALADPDAWPGTDLLLRRAATHLEPDRWRPWRGYAAQHLWTSATLDPQETP